MSDPAWVVLASGTVAIGGSVAVTILQHHYQTRRERSERNLKRLEQLLQDISAFEDWLADHDSKTQVERVRLRGSPFCRIEGAAVHFPDLHRHTGELNLAVLAYRAWVMQHAEDAKVDLNEYAAKYEPLARKLSDLKQRIRVLVMEQHAKDRDGLLWSWWYGVKA